MTDRERGVPMARERLREMAKAEAVVNRGQYVETYRTERGAASSEKAARVHNPNHKTLPAKCLSKRPDKYLHNECRPFQPDITMTLIMKSSYKTCHPGCMTVWEEQTDPLSPGAFGLSTYSPLIILKKDVSATHRKPPTKASIWRKNLFFPNISEH